MNIILPGQDGFDEPTEERDCYTLINAEKRRAAFKNFFNIYAHELSEYNPWLATQVSDDGDYLPVQVEEYFNDPNKYPYVLLHYGRPAGLLVLALYPAESADERDSFDIEEFFVAKSCRGSGIARDIVKRVWDHAKIPCDLRVLKGNEHALRFWEKQIALRNAEYTKHDGENGMYIYRVEL